MSRFSAHFPIPSFSCLNRAAILCVLVALAMHSPELLRADENNLIPTIEVLNSDNWDRLVPRGKEVDAIYGDYVLRNQWLTAVIAQPLETRNANMTVRAVGGCLIDLTTNHFQSDQLSAWYPGRKKQRFSKPTITANAQSSTNSDGTVHQDGSVSLTMEAEGTETLPFCRITWSLNSHDHAIQLTTVWMNHTSGDLSLILEDDVRADGGKEDMIKSANGTHELFTIHDRYWQQAYGWRSHEGLQIRCNGNARESTLVYESESTKSITLKPGESYTQSRELFVARDMSELKALVANAITPQQTAAWFDQKKSPDQWGPVLQVKDGNGSEVSTGLLTFSQGDLEVGTRRLDQRPSAHLPLAPGNYEVALTVAGQNFGKQPISIPNLPAAELSEAKIELSFSDFRPGDVAIRILDEAGTGLPAKVEFLGAGGLQNPDFAPESSEFLVKNLAYTPNGQVNVPLQAGAYDLIISHGPEFDAIHTNIVVESGKTTELKTILKRSVDTTGWVSADFHSHSSPSGDNTSSQLGRVLNLAAEHIEFAPCTEHNRISSYEEHIESQNLRAFISSVPGMELTGSPLPLNHQNVFPLIYRPRTQDGGGPTTDGSPETQMERIVAWDNHSEKLIQQNHPDLGWLFFDKDGNQKPDEGFSRSFGLMNVVEVHPIDPLLNLTPMAIRDGQPTGNQTVFNWLQLLNQGYRIYGVVNTDSHYNFHGSGGLRLWLKSSTDDPSEISSDEMRESARNGHIIMSNGPFLDVSFSAAESQSPPVIPGQDLSARLKRVQAMVRVECPNWIDVDTVFVLVNGRRRDDLVFTRESHPELFGSGSVKFSEKLEFELSGDAHLIVVAGHRTQTLGDVSGPFWGAQHPVAVSNPVFVDVDNGEFNSSKDTLDAPLPVKFAAPK